MEMQTPVATPDKNGYRTAETIHWKRQRSQGDRTMRHLALFACVLFLCVGCAADDQWGEALKDLRGDNMQMHSAGSGISGTMHPPSQDKPGS
jgi:hypothetical protein